MDANLSHADPDRVGAPAWAAAFAAAAVPVLLWRAGDSASWPEAAANLAVGALMCWPPLAAWRHRRGPARR